MIVSHIYYCEITSLQKKKAKLFHLRGAVVSLQVLKIHPIHLNGIQLLRICWIHHPSGSNHVAKFDDVPGRLWLLGGFWNQSMWKNMRSRQIGSSPHKGWKKSLKAEPRRTFITFLLPNSPTGPTFFVLDFLKRHLFSQENTGLNYNPAFLLQFVGMRKRTFQKRERKEGRRRRLKWFLSNYDVSGHHQEDQLVVNLNTLKPTSPKMHLEFWNPGPWNTSKRFKSSSVFRAICKCSKYWTGGENFFGILSRYLTNQWDLDLKPKKAPKLQNGNFILDASTGPAPWRRNSS